MIQITFVKDNMASNISTPQTQNVQNKMPSFFKKRTKLTLYVLIFLFTCAVTLAVFINKKPQSVPQLTAPVPTSTPIPPGSPFSNDSYFLNRINTLQPINGYSWKNNKLVYSTSNGIFYAGTNQAINNIKIQKAIWSENGSIVFNNNNHWFFSQLDNQKQIPIDYVSENILINPVGDTLLLINKVQVTLFKPLSSQTFSKSFDQPILQAVWSKNSSNILFVLSNNEILFVDYNLNILNKITTPFKLISVSPDAKTLIFQNGRVLIVQPISGDSFNLEFTKDSKLTAFWTDTNLFVIETIKDSLSRNLDYIWKISSDGQRTFLVNSMPIPRKINLEIPIIPNSANTVIPLAEKNGQLWLLSLTPNNIPGYTSAGLVFLPFSNKGD